MNFIVRSVRLEDVGDIFQIARQFSLLNLPADKTQIEEKIRVSIDSFSGILSKEKSTYMFVAQELETGRVAGCSQIVGKHGTEENPNYSVKVSKKERYSRDLGIGFIHQILSLKINIDGGSEIGGLVVDRAFRSRPEKIGKLVSLGRFLYIGLMPDRFETKLMAEMAPPLSPNGRSEFWEAYGRRFTGMTYLEADELSRQNKEFIKSLFPEEGTYLCLLDGKARLALGRVGEETRPALHMLEKQGFRYINEVDPFDGGPHIAVDRDKVSIIAAAKSLPAYKSKSGPFDELVYVSYIHETEFYLGQTPCRLEENKIILPIRSFRALSLEESKPVYFSPA